MKFITVKSFLCCMSLETGGFVISGVHLAIQTLILLFGIAFLTIYDCHDFEVMIGTSENRICLFNRDFVAFMLLSVTFSISFALLPYWCIKAIKTRHFTNIKPFLWFLAFVAIFSMYDLVFLTLEGVALALLKGSVNVYMFCVIYSLYMWLRDGPRPLSQTQHPADLNKKSKLNV